MSRKLPLISGTDAVKAFTRAGWHLDRILGSHAIVRKEGSAVTLSIPLHQEMRTGLLRSLIKDANIDLEDFINYLIILEL